MAHVLLLSSALAWLAFASALGIYLPSHVSLGGSAKADLLAGVSAGVLLSVALLHLLDDAQERLEPLTEYPAANAVALLGYLIMATTQALMPCLHGQSNRMLLTPLVDGAQPDSDLVRARFYALEASISLHSVLIGLGMGFAHSGVRPPPIERAMQANLLTSTQRVAPRASCQWKELLVLALALTVHQFFEGFALGMFARRAHLSPLAWYVTGAVCALFSLPLRFTPHACTPHCSHSHLMYAHLTVHIHT
jgi:zinc transporter ZupT